MSVSLIALLLVKIHVRPIPQPQTFLWVSIEFSAEQSNDLTLFIHVARVIDQGHWFLFRKRAHYVQSPDAASL